MFSKLYGLFKGTNTNKPSIIMQQICQHVLASNMMPLPNGLILIGGAVSDIDDSVNLELYDPNKKTKVTSRHLKSKGCPRFLCISQDLVLMKCKDSNHLYVINPSTLESDKRLETHLNQLNFYNAVYLGEQKFATFSYGKSTQCPYVIRVHDLLTMEFNQPASLNLICPIDNVNILNFKALANGLFACTVEDHYSAFLQVLLFKREPGAKIQFTQINTLYPKTQPLDSCGSVGNFVELSDGRILTYHRSGDHFQIWQDDGQCVDEWSWHQGITCHDETFKSGFWTDKVVPLLDGEHLLVLAHGNKLFLFNMKTRVITPVNLGTELPPRDIDIFANGQIAVRMADKQKNTRLLCLDFKEMIAYRNNVQEQLLSVNLNKDVGGIVTSYLYSSR